VLWPSGPRRGSKAATTHPARSRSTNAYSPSRATSPPGSPPAVRAVDVDAVDAILAESPSLAGAETPNGASAILVAAFTLNPDGETFSKPANNAMLRALLRCRPTLGIHEAALAGDVVRLTSLLSVHPELANALHRAAGTSPLHLAAFGDQPRAIELLLEKGARVDGLTNNKFHNTPLMTAMLGDAVNAASVLLEKGANVEIPEEGGFRALHIAAESGDERLVKLLLDHHAQIDPRSDDGTTPLGVATRKGREGIATLLRARGA
jgi:ankyrin repeat protein